MKELNNQVVEVKKECDNINDRQESLKSEIHLLEVEQDDLEANIKMKEQEELARRKNLPLFNQFLNQFLNLHSFNKLYNAEKEKMKEARWEEYKEANRDAPAAKSNAIFGMFKKSGSDIGLKMQFEIKEKVAEMYEAQELQRALKTRILALKEDKEMSDREIRMVKEAIMPHIVDY